MLTEPVGDLIDFNDDESRTDYGSWTAAYDLALALVRARQISELSQAELAEKLGTSQAYIAKLESGEANPTIRKVGAILGALWLRLEMRPIPLRPYEGDYSAQVTFSITEPSAANFDSIPVGQLGSQVKVPTRSQQSLDVMHYTRGAKGVNVYHAA